MISLMILLITFTGTTYAWFKINSNATVSGFNFTVTGGEGYQISLNGDADSYSSQLTSAQMRQAILCGYSSDYTVKNGKLYKKDDEMSDSATAEEIKKYILLSPVTPHVITADDLPTDGSQDQKLGQFQFRNQYGSPIYASSGKFIEFSIYVKANGGLQDQNKYDLYLLGSDVEDVVNSNNNVVTVSRTSIKSKDVNEIQLKRDMNTVKYGQLHTGQKVNVYTSNALRFSIGNDYEVLGKDTNNIQIQHTNQIFELSDDQADDLGSYATTYPYANQADKTAGTQIPATEQSTELDNLYNADENAMFTYYNNIRPYSKLEALDYEKKPNTIRKLPTEQEIKEAADPYNATYKFVEVRSGYSAKKVTFRFWLEGWDADCFDGISQSIRVNLSFGSFKNGIKSR